MQKEKFQEYLYKPESIKTADLAELEKLCNDYPWFSTAAIILLNSSKSLADPNFDSLLKKLSISIPNRKYIQKTLHSQTIQTIESQTPKPESEELSVQQNLQSDTSKMAHENSGFDNILDSLKDEELLDFSYSPKNTVGTNPPEQTEKEIEAVTEIAETSDTGSRQSFDHWISSLGNTMEQTKTPVKKQEIIESFIQSDPGVIRADKETKLEGDIAKDSSEENEGFITDTLAKIYLKQGLYNKAIYAYEKLCLKYPEKSVYFVTQIEEIRSLYIKK